MSEDRRDGASVTKSMLTALEEALGDRPGPIGLAVSGGRDSMVLLEAAARSRGALPCLESPIVLHLDHGLRRDSAADRRFVTARAASLGLRAESDRIDVAALHAAHGGSLEETARTARYGWLGERARALGLTAVLTAHHADDQIETVALQALRGAPSLGLAGIPRTRRLSLACDALVIRPLLDVTRAALEDVTDEWDVPFRDDVSNTDLRHRRNLLRHVMLPVGEVRHDVRRRLGELGARATAANRRVARLAAAVEREVGVSVVDDEDSRRCSVPRAPLRGLPIEVSWSVLDRLVARCHPGFGHLGARAFTHILEDDDGTTLELARDLHVDLIDDDTGSIAVFRRTILGETPPPWGPLPLNVGGAVRVPVTGGAIGAELVEDAAPTHSPFEQWLEQDRVRGALRVRPARHGEKLRPFGMDGSKLVSDLYAEAGVPAAERWSRPVVADDDGILWIPGVRAAERCRVTRGGPLLRLTHSG